MFPLTTHKPVIFSLFPAVVPPSDAQLSSCAIAGIVKAVIVAVELVGVLSYCIHARRYAVWTGTPRVNHAKKNLMMLHFCSLFT